MTTARKVYRGDGKRRMLSLDGGGILGVISLEILKEMETQIRAEAGADDSFRLCDFFDYFAGTSTGAIIAAGLAIGMSVDELSALYKDHADKIFTRAWIWNRLRRRYDHHNLAELLQHYLTTKTIGTLREEGAIKSLLLIATRNISTKSPWLVSTNEADLYAGPTGKLPLWQLVRASTAAPFYFAPETLPIYSRRGGEPKLWLFEDGGLTAYNNPAMALFRHAVHPVHWVQKDAPVPGPWDTGEDKMMLISVGTGGEYNAEYSLNPRGQFFTGTAKRVPSDLIAAMAIENDINCRTFGRCVYGPRIDSVLKSLFLPDDDFATAPRPKFFSYARYNPDISEGGLKTLGLSDVDHKTIEMDNISKIDDFIRIGQKAAEVVDMKGHFPTFV